MLGEKDLASLNDVTSILNEGGFEVLHNEYRTIYFNNATIGLFGLESSGDISGLINENNQDIYKLVAVHEPDYVHGYYTKNKSQLVISNGLGMENGYEYRLFCPNQINIITLKK